LHNYFLGISWFTLALLFGVTNDLIVKILTVRFDTYEIVAMRILFTTMPLLPVLTRYHKLQLITSVPFIHIARSVLFFISTLGWTYGLASSPLTLATLANFSIPIFILLLSSILLHERSSKHSYFGSIIIFIGLAIAFEINFLEINWNSFIFIISAFGFALLDIINKKVSSIDSSICILLYSSCFNIILALPYCVMYWVTPSYSDLFLFVCLGFSSNLVLLFLLRSYKIVKISSLAPMRYWEIIISSVMAYFILNEIPSYSIFIGSIVIIPASLYVFYFEAKIQLKSTRD
jgi:S-adenosylmethionine uptake transporter